MDNKKPSKISRRFSLITFFGMIVGAIFLLALLTGAKFGIKLDTPTKAREMPMKL